MMRFLKPTLVFRQLRPLLGANPEFSSFVKVWHSVPCEAKALSGTNLQNVRFYCEKIERPQGMDSKPKESKKAARGPISWLNLGVSGVLVGVMMAFYYYARGLKEDALNKERKQALGKAKIGGTFDLIDHNGKRATSDDFKGKWVFLYFGFTHCPDICPEEMEKIAEVVDELEKKASKYGEVQPLFITVDPKRDGVKEVAEYVKEFHPKLIGLTGTEEQIKEACKAYRVYYSAGPEDQDEDYIVDHTIIVYLINPDNEFLDYYGQTKDKDMIVNSTLLHMGRYYAEHNQEKGRFGVFSK